MPVESPRVAETLRLLQSAATLNDVLDWLESAAGKSALTKGQIQGARRRIVELGVAGVNATAVGTVQPTAPAPSNGLDNQQCELNALHSEHIWSRWGVHHLCPGKVPAVDRAERLGPEA